jgi:uncharacterized protein (TIGR02996 family)
MNEQHFLEAISDAPRDAAGLRLVYADWLEEQGDERGEFIRIQEEIASLPAWSERVVELRPRREELRPRMSAEWLHELGYPRYRPLFRVPPETREQRWRVLTEFIRTWVEPGDTHWGLGTIDVHTHEQYTGQPCSVAQREWFRQFGALADRLSVRLPRLSMEYSPARVQDPPPASEDPPIPGVHGHVCESTSEYLTYRTVRELLDTAPHCGEARLRVRDSAWQALEQTLSPIPVRVLGPVDGAVRMFEGDDLITLDYRRRLASREWPDEHVFWLHVHAKTPAALEQLPPTMRAALKMHPAKKRWGR